LTHGVGAAPAALEFENDRLAVVVVAPDVDWISWRLVFPLPRAKSSLDRRRLVEQ